MNTPTEDKFRNAYAVYDRKHAEQRDAMLAALSQVPTARHMRLRPVAAALAAVFLVALGIVGFMSIRPTPASASTACANDCKHYAACMSKDFIYQRTMTPFGVATVRFPTERYYGRPSRSFHTSYGFSSQGNDNLVKVTRAYAVCDGQRSLLVRHDEKKAVLTTALDPLETELSIESVLQVSETGQLVSGHPEDFERVGTERVEGNWCDIYQSKPLGDFGFWRRIWVDPSKETAGSSYGIPSRIRRPGRATTTRTQRFIPMSTRHRSCFPLRCPRVMRSSKLNDAPKVRPYSGRQQLAGGDLSRWHMDWVEY